MTNKDFERFAELFGQMFDVTVKPHDRTEQPRAYSVCERWGGRYFFFLNGNQHLVVFTSNMVINMPAVLITRLECKTEPGMTTEFNTLNFRMGEVPVVSASGAVRSPDDFAEMKAICDRYNEEMEKEI